MTIVTYILLSFVLFVIVYSWPMHEFQLWDLQQNYVAQIVCTNCKILIDANHLKLLHKFGWTDLLVNILC